MKKDKKELFLVGREGGWEGGKEGGRKGPSGESVYRDGAPFTCLLAIHPPSLPPSLPPSFLPLLDRLFLAPQEGEGS